VAPCELYRSSEATHSSGRRRPRKVRCTEAAHYGVLQNGPLFAPEHNQFSHKVTYNQITQTIKSNQLVQQNPKETALRSWWIVQEWLHVNYADHRKLRILQGTDVHARSAAQRQLIMGFCKTGRCLHLSTTNSLTKSLTIKSLF